MDFYWYVGEIDLMSKVGLFVGFVLVVGIVVFGY